MYKELIPDEIQAEYISIRESTLEKSFRIGELTADCVLRNPEEKKAIVYRAAASYVGLPSRTVREYTDVFSFYPKEAQERFEVLAFSHFRKAYNKDNWEEMLTWAVEQADVMGGRPATVDAMIKEFCYNEDENIIVKLMEKLNDWFERLAKELTPEQIIRVHEKINEIEKIVNEEIKVVEVTPHGSELKEFIPGSVLANFAKEE